MDQGQQGADCALLRAGGGARARGLSRSEIGPAVGMKMGELAALEAAAEAAEPEPPALAAREGGGEAG